MQLRQRFVLVLHRFDRLMSKVPKYIVSGAYDDSKTLENIIRDMIVGRRF